jgi:murein DD-endopeptidase MepM/ murein hydrolase activator NlpD
MRSPRYSVLIANQETGSYTRVKLTRGALWAGVCALLSVPVLIGALAVGVVRAELVSLRLSNESLQVENEGYRTSTLELVGEVAALQGAIGELDTNARLDPVTAKASSRLPTVVRTRAIGGGSTTALPSPEETLGQLAEALDSVAERLTLVRQTVENQRALAQATPMLWPVTGWLSSSFGSRKDPFTGAPDFHPGVDISALKGTPVFATADGTVRSAGFNGAYGNAVMLDHGFGIATRFGHLSGFAIAAGQQVRRGDVIGYVGSTGRATSSHLHYEILLNGRVVNPWPLLTARP